MSEFRQLPIRRICRFAYGDSLPGDSRAQGDTPVVGSNGAVGYHDTANTRGPVLIVGRKGSFGKVNWYGQPVFAIDTTYYVDRTQTTHELRWLYYVLGAAGLDGFSQDTGVPGLSREAAYATRVPFVPDSAGQSAIAEFLDRKTAAIDALIEKKERLIALLQEKRQALITQAVTKGLDPNVPMKSSGIEWLGEIPAHWDMKCLKHLSPGVSVGIVITPAKYYDDEGTVPALRSLNVRERRIDRENLVHISQASNALLSKSMLRAGDLVAVRTGQPGKTAVVPSELDGANCVDVIIIRQGASFSSQYLCEFMNSSVAHIQYSEGSEGAIQQHFNIETAKNLLLPAPPLDEQRAIASHLMRVHEREDRLLELNQLQVNRLREYRQAVITAAVTGKLDVSAETT